MLGGRAYGSAAQRPTFAQRGYVMGVLRTTGLDRVIAKDGDLLGAILDAGCASKLLAGLLTEDGKPWDRETALATAAFFDGLTSDEDYDAYLSAVEALLAGFLVHRGTSSTPSPTSSRRRKSSAEKRAASRAKKLTSDSAAGPTSAPPSPSTPAPGSTT